MTKNYKGFTLIEMLVVVLIIGILAAIALPQYRRAVAKAELAQIITAVKSLRSATDRYYLIHDEYAKDINALDITITSNVNCRLDGSSPLCYNDKFALSRHKFSNFLECAAKTQDVNSALAQACKNFTNAPNCFLSNGSSNCVSYLQLIPCIVCQTEDSPI